jgi:pilus assembly protein TadC
VYQTIGSGQFTYLQRSTLVDILILSLFIIGLIIIIIGLYLTIRMRNRLIENLLDEALDDTIVEECVDYEIYTPISFDLDPVTFN